MQKYIFDLDGTILHADWDMEDKFFKDNLDNKLYEEFHNNGIKTILEYEEIHDKYDIDRLSDFYKTKGMDVSKDFIKKWIDFTAYTMHDNINEKIYELFDILKEDNKEIILLTNWFGESQKGRLKRKNLLDYFDNIISGDIALKPNKECFDLAVLNTPKNECIMIGDNYHKDYLGALNYGMNAFLIDEENDINKLLEVVKNDRRSKSKIK